MKLGKFLTTIILFLTLSYQLGAKEMIYFSHYSNYDGLKSNRILSMTVDNDGYVWVSTDFGISRFDGKQFKNYTTKEYPNLLRNDVMSIINYNEKEIMIGGMNGMLFAYNKEKDEFVDKMPTYFDKTFYRSITKFYNTPKGLFAISDNGGAFLYDDQQKEFTEEHPYFEKTQYTLINSLFIDSYDRMWCGSYDFFTVIDKNGKEIFTYHSPHQPCGIVSSIIEIDPHHVMVCSTLGEVWIFEISEDHISNPTILTVPFASTSNVLKDSKGCYWFTTDGYGLWKSETLKDGDFQEIIPINASKMEISKIYTIQEGLDGTIWIGTQNRGIWGIARRENVPMFFSEEIGFPEILCSCFAKDKNGNLYVGTDGGGLYQVDKKFNTVKEIELPNKNITAMCAIDNHKLALSTWGKGVIYYDYQTQKVSIDNFKGIDDPTHNFFGINYINNVLYACSAGDGLYALAPNETWQNIAMEDTAKHIGNMWATTTLAGLGDVQWTLTTNSLVFHKNGKCTSLIENLTEQKVHNQVSLNDATCLATGDLVIVTNKNILLAHADNLSIDTLKKLPTYQYMSVQVDDYGKVWASYIGGILYFNPYTQVYTEISKDFSDMSKYFFMNRSKYKTDDGIILFGSNGGFVSIDTKQDITESEIGHLAFSELFLPHEKVRPYSDLLPHGGLGKTDKLTLKHDQTNISISVDCIDYDRTMPVTLQYRLLNYSDDWQKMNSNIISFNHIPAGKYVLEVMAYRSSTEHNKVITLPIVVKAPWWKTIWFSVFLVLILVATSFCFFRYRTKRLEKAKQALTQMVAYQTKELRCSLQEKNRILSVIAHDLKNPMFAISSTLRNWSEKGVQAVESAQVDLVYNTSLRLQEEMQKLLDWARSGQENIAWNPQNCNFKELVDNVLSLQKKQIEDKGLTISVSLDELTHYVIADALSLEIILRNLISNAIKFTPKGGSISVQAKEENNKMNLKVSDTGIGMTAEQIQNLLQKGLHNSTEGTNGERGTGLGISLCDNYIRRNNGTMSIESKEGHGTSICVDLPLSNEEIVVVEIDETLDNKDCNSTSILNGNIILWIDDEPLLCKAIQESLSPYANIITASNGVAALEILKTTRVDVIISDVSMPEMDGIEFAKAVKKNKEYCHIPILFASANSDERDRLLGLLSGAMDYINKPFNMDEVILKLSNILVIRQKIQQRLLQSMMMTGEKATTNKTTEEVKTDEMLNPDLRKFMKILEEKYTDTSLQTESLAAEMTMSLSTLFRKIKSLTGKTPVDLLNEYRLNKAMQLLSNPQNDTPIAEIAYQCGFSDSSYFAKKFKEQYKLTPSQYRQKI